MSEITGRPKKAAGKKYVKRLICFPPEVAELLDRLPRGERSAFVVEAVRRFDAYLQSFSPPGSDSSPGLFELNMRKAYLDSYGVLACIQESAAAGSPYEIGGVEYHAPGAE